MSSTTFYFLFFAVLLSLFGFSSAAAQSADSTARPTSVSDKWTIEHVLKQESISDVAIAPDGRRVLWTKRTPDFEKDRTTSDLHLTFADTTGDPETIQLTRTGDNRSPQWSQDGQTIAFISSRKNAEAKEGENGGDEKAQIWLMDVRGGEPRALTSLENPPERFHWLDSTRILLSAREAPTADEKARKEAKDDATAIEDTARFYAVRLFTVDTQSKEVKRITTNGHQIGEFAPDPSGRYVVYDLDTSPIDSDARNQGRQYLLDLE
ncbi:MAG: TolB family protein, partial [Rhodothermales bacterium]